MAHMDAVIKIEGNKDSLKKFKDITLNKKGGLTCYKLFDYTEKVKSLDEDSEEWDDIFDELHEIGGFVDNVVEHFKIHKFIKKTEPSIIYNIIFDDIFDIEGGFVSGLSKRLPDLTFYLVYENTIEGYLVKYGRIKIKNGNELPALNEDFPYHYLLYEKW